MLTRLALGLATLGLGGPGCGKDDRPATWEYISPVIFQPQCATGSCHSRAAAVAGLDFSDPDRGYTSLTALWVWIVDPKGTPEQGCMLMKGTDVCQRYERGLVVPFDPSQSRLVNVLRANAAPRMPPNRPLAEGDIALVERWILNGANRVAGTAAVDAGAVAVDAGKDAAAEAASDGRAEGPTADAGSAAPGGQDAAGNDHQDAGTGSEAAGGDQ